MKEKIVLQQEYSSHYRYAVWSKFREAIERSLLGRRRFIVLLESEIEKNLYRIELENDPDYEFEWPAADESRRFITEFVNKGDKRVINITTFRYFDAFVQITFPKFRSALKGKDDLDSMGEIVGHFLRDPNVGEVKYLQEQAKQNILHFFEYDNVDTIGTHDETVRYLCLFVGRTPDYLFALDFAFRTDNVVFLGDDEKLRLFYGFCAPGENFSPLVMRSYCLRERLAGILYNKSTLVDLDGEKLRQLQFDVFTTDRAFHGQPTAQYDQHDVVRRALIAQKGAKLGRPLNRVPKNSAKYALLKDRVDRFKFDFL